MRTCNLHIEKYAQADWPRLEVDFRGERVCLEQVFLDAGIKLDIHLGDGAIPLLDTAPLNRSQLHELAHRCGFTAGDGSWRATVLIVPMIAYVERGKICRPYGVMYDFGDHDLDGCPRQGCALAYERVRRDPVLSLRTLAHELGHVFNLLHPSDDDPPRPVGTSLMNRTADLRNIRRRLGRFPENIAWRFSASDRRWLSSAPEAYVRPGGHPFGTRPPRNA